MPCEDQYPPHADRPPRIAASRQAEPLGKSRVSRLEGSAVPPLALPVGVALHPPFAPAVHQSWLAQESPWSRRRMDSRARLPGSGCPVVSRTLEGAAVTRSRDAFLERVRR